MHCCMSLYSKISMAWRPSTLHWATFFGDICAGRFGPNTDALWGHAKCFLSVLLMIYIVDIINALFLQVFCPAPNSWSHFDQFCSVHRQSSPFLRRAGQQLTPFHWPITLGDWAIWIPIGSCWSNWWQYHFPKQPESVIFSDKFTFSKPAFLVDVVQFTIESWRSSSAVKIHGAW